MKFYGAKRQEARGKSKNLSSWLLAHGSRAQRGFTLVEMIVAIGLFATVMLITVAAMLALAGANRKAQALQSVMNNLNVALDGMVRSVRSGSEYHCGDGVYTAPQNCSEGGTTFAFEHYGGDRTSAADQWIYWFENGRLFKSETGSKVNGFPITAPEVVIDNMSFHVIGTTRGDEIQPKVLMNIKGTAQAQNVAAKTTFIIQATAVQRLLDL